MRKILRFFPAAVILRLAAGGLGAQTVPLDIEFGYRILDVSGNQDEYRTQVNERTAPARVYFATTDFEARISGIASGGWVRAGSGLRARCA
jgi:hypothetical protein